MQTIQPGSIVISNHLCKVVLKVDTDHVLVRELCEDNVETLALSEVTLATAAYLQPFADAGIAAAFHGLALLGAPKAYPAKTETPPEPVRSSLEALIEDYHWAVTVARCGSNTLFSVGAHHVGMPEVIVSGLNPKLGLRLVNEVLTKLVELKEAGKFDPAIPQPINMSTWNFPFYWVPVDRSTVTAVFEEADTRSTGEAVYAQIVMPDPNCNFPWDSGYSAKMKQAQAYFGYRVPDAPKPRRGKDEEGHEVWIYDGAVVL